MAKSKKKAEMVSLTFRCKCGALSTCDDVSFEADADECGLCGSHGSVRAWVYCRECRKSSEIVLEEW